MQISKKAIALCNRFFYIFAPDQRKTMAHISIDTDNLEFQNALKLLQYTHQSVFLTGKAGTGKSTFLKYVCQTTKKKFVVLAPTGIAAINAGGSTLHSFFKLPLHPLLPDDPKFSLKGGKLHSSLKYSASHRKLIKNIELIIIDEISMVRADIIDFIDKILRVYSHNMREPFGGKQLLLVGDIFQLEPVVKSEEREIINRFYPNPFFFSAHVFQSVNLVSIELKKVYRQKDKVFISLLDHIRTNTVTKADLQLINTRYNAPIETKGNDMYITLASRKDTVDYINENHLNRLPGSAITLHGHIHGEFPENNLPTLMELIVKPGAQIIFIKNDLDKRWVNGTIGTISGIDANDIIHVITEEGKEVDVRQEMWKNIRYQYNEKEKKIEEEELGTFIQYPIRLAWAITIHKSQGLTFNKVIIDFSGGVFAGGQVYVALSRCTSFDGICLKQKLTTGNIFVRPEIIAFSQYFNNQDALDRAMQESQTDIEYISAVKAFDNRDFEQCLQHFFKAIHARYDIEKPLQQRFIRKKLSIIHKLHEENRQLKEALNTQQENLRKYAREYYLMGNECVTHIHDIRAALANYDKAIELYPQYVDAWIRKGITLFNNKQTQAAEECLNTAIAINPVEFKAFYNRGKLRLYTGDIEGAVSDLDKATTLKPQHAGGHECFGDALLKAGKESEANLQYRLAEIIRKKKES